MTASVFWDLAFDNDVLILCSDTSQITPYSREFFFAPLWRTIKNHGRSGSGREDRLIFLDIRKNKKKRKYKFENAMLCEAFNRSNSADREEDKPYYRFPSIVKNNG